jgi:hypothetical protein
VTRRLWRRPRWRRANVDDGGGIVDVADGLDGVAVAVVVAVLVLALLFLPLILFLVELPIAAVLVAWRAARGRWTVVARSGETRLAWTAAGGRASRRLVDDRYGARDRSAAAAPPRRSVV